MQEHPTFRLEGQSMTVTPLGGPLDQDPPPPLVIEIGRAITSFARLEYMVTAVALHINKEKASAALYEYDPNSKFPQMLKLVRKWISSHPAHANLQTPYDDFLFGELAKDAVFRNQLAHGFVHGFDPATGTGELRALHRTREDRWEHQTIDISISGVEAMRQRAVLATRHFVEIAKLVFRKAPDGQSQTPEPLP